MAPSQLKQLKASLRDSGVLGPQQSKKVRKQNSKDAQKRIQRNVALDAIRDRFNPFEVKAPARKVKFDVATGKSQKTAVGRPGVTRGLGEERRRETLLKEMQSRNKTGGLLDRRFGENDPTMTPEQRAAERFARQNEQRNKKTSMFNLEDDSEDELTLTHGGRSLFGGSGMDDFDDNDINSSGSDNDDQDQDQDQDLDDRPRKKARFEDGSEVSEMMSGEDDDAAPQRKKTKNEVMKEIIAKSKMYKAERQAAKADDDEIRMALNKDMADVYAALRDHTAPEKTEPVKAHITQEPQMDPARAAMLAGKSREDAEKEYEANLRQLKLEARSKPSVRTKTEEEIAAETASKLQDLERKRVRRMKGEAESSDEEDDEPTTAAEPTGDEDFIEDDAETFGLNAPEPVSAPKQELDVEDEDEFFLEDDLDASDPEAELASDLGSSDEDSEAESEDDGDDDFINGLVLPKTNGTTADSATLDTNTNSNLAFSFPCPQSHAEFLKVVKGTAQEDLPTVVQRIRALHHKSLAPGNQEKLDTFAGVLCQHIPYLVNNSKTINADVVSKLVRHIHSMAKSNPLPVAATIREHLSEIDEQRPLALLPGDLIILSAIGTIFPTSDRLHAVVTPAALTIARYLGQNHVQSLHDLYTGAFLCTTALQYQEVAKRYIPEVITYIGNALAILSPKPLPSTFDGTPIAIPIRLPSTSLRIQHASSPVQPRLILNDLCNRSPPESSGCSLVHNFCRLTDLATQLWSSKSAFPEVISPLLAILTFYLSHNTAAFPSSLKTTLKSTHTNLKSALASSIESRRPLLLHNHRPLAIKSSLPSFIDNFNPDRHYDPDRQRAELSKLKAEHKKERKGAMRELRKDANFMAREQLREKKTKDAAYERKFKRLVAEIQGEEGREKNGYEREVRRRKGKN